MYSFNSAHLVHMPQMRFVGWGRGSSLRSSTIVPKRPEFSTVDFHFMTPETFRGDTQLFLTCHQHTKLVCRNGAHMRCRLPWQSCVRKGTWTCVVWSINTKFSIYVLYIPGCPYPMFAVFPRCSPNSGNRKHRAPHWSCARKSKKHSSYRSLADR